MGLRLSAAARNAAADAIAGLVAGGLLRIYSGTQPTDPDTSPGGTLLAELALNSPAFDSAATGTAALDVTPSVQDTAANATGTAGWFRLANSSGTGAVDGTVTATGGGGDITLSSTSVVSGGTVTITSGSITMPAS